MANPGAWLQLARELQAAAGKQDWNAVALLDRKLARELAGIAAVPEHERAALLTLRKVHAQALQLCADEKQRLGLQLGDIHSKQEGWVAYAIEGAMYQDENPV